MCTNCGRLVDAASAVDSDATPSPGDVTICLMCGHLMAFDDKLMMRELTDAEIIEAAGDRRIVTVQKARRKLKQS